MHAITVILFLKNDIRADHECGAPQRGPRLMHARAQGGVGLAAQGAAQQD